MTKKGVTLYKFGTHLLNLSGEGSVSSKDSKSKRRDILKQGVTHPLTRYNVTR